ncbi:MAG: hypothetical protein KAJ92_02525 [Gammaproteobacteria bacterium]|nr:hypothetical protein [Gammaproteobacteria bacterium]
MKKIKILFIATLLFSSYLNAATITWDTVNSSSFGGDIFNLNVVGTGFASNVDGGGVDLSFDSSVVNVLSVTIDELVWDFGGAGINTGTIDNVAGTVNGIMVNALSAVTGDFTVATIQFQTIAGFGSTSGLTLTEYALNPWASGGSAINPTFVGGNVSVVPVPAAVWLFGSGLIGLIVTARRKYTA